jgi:hypothetical protein
LKQTFNGWHQGRRYGYPLCCILHFLWDGLIGWPSAMVRWHQIDSWDDSDFVPCGVVHAGGSPYRLGTRIRRILRFNIRRFAPTAASRQRREIALHGSRRWRTAEPELKVWASAHGERERLYWDQGGLDPELNWS